MKVGFILNVICVLVLIASIETLGEYLFQFHSVPGIMMNNITSSGSYNLTSKFQFHSVSAIIVNNITSSGSYNLTS